MNDKVHEQAMVQTMPRDRAQEDFVKVLARPVSAGDSAAANRRVTDAEKVIASMDLSSATQLQRRLSKPGDRLSKYFHSRFQGKTTRRLTETLKLHLLAIRGVDPPQSSQVSLPGVPVPRIKASSLGGPLIRLLRKAMPAGSTERFTRIQRLFSSADAINARRLLVRLETDGDELRELYFSRLSETRALWLIDNVLHQVANSVPVESLPENLSNEELDLMVRRGQLSDASTGRVFRGPTERFRRENYEEAAERGIAETRASVRLLEDLDLERKYPLPADTIRLIMEEVAKNKTWLRKGRHRDDDKVALGQFLGQIKQLRQMSGKDRPFVYVLGVWSRLLDVNHPDESGTYLATWTRWLGRYGQILEQRYKDELNRVGYMWIQAVVMPGPLEFVLELVRTGELVKLKNFKAAALGGFDAFVSFGKGIVSVFDEETWIQFYDDWAEHGSDFFTVFDSDTIDLVKGQLSRDFNAFAMLDETKQARTASHILTSAVIDHKIPDITRKGVNVTSDVARGVRDMLEKKKSAGGGLPNKVVKRSHNPKTGRKFLRGAALKREFRKWVFEKVRADHPLAFLFEFDSNGKPLKWKGKGQRAPDVELFEDLLSVDAGHIKSESLIKAEGRIDNEFVMIELRWENQGPRSKKVEGKKVAGLGFQEKPAIDIGGIPVDLETARVWVRYGLLDESWVKSAKRSRGWNQDP